MSASLRLVQGGGGAPLPDGEGYAVLVPAGGGWVAASVGSRTVLGGASACVAVRGSAIAERHCALRAAPEGVLAVDLGGGTTLNGQACAPRPVLARPGQVLRLAGTPAVIVREKTSRHGRWLGFGQFGSFDPPCWPLVAELAMLAAAPLPMLLLGESGTGKEWAARAIHQASPRAAGPFVAVNCACLGGDLAMAELFGADKGAYTGCADHRKGAFERASGGTLFLDEVGELPPAAQAAMLRVLECGEIQVLGGPARKVDVRIVCATHRDLPAMIQAGKFRLDLWHRIAVGLIELPPLRARTADLLPAAEALLAEACAQTGAELQLGAAAAQLLLRCDWPGNFRQLRNAMARLAATCGGGCVDESAAMAALQIRREAPPSVDWADKVEAVRCLLQRGESTQSAWRQSGLPRATFYRYARLARAA